MQKQCSKIPKPEEFSDRRVIIDLDSLSNNYNIIKKYSPSSQVIAYVKGDAYGHGIVDVVRELRNSGVTMFAVASINELIAIREHFSDVRVLVSSTYYCVNSLNIIARYSGDIVVFSQYHIDLLENITLPKKLNIWLKLNTGMNRMGISYKDLDKALCSLNKCISINKDNIVLMSHFACADDNRSDMSEQQLDRFISVTKNYHLRRSMANSSAILNYPDSHFDIVRPGLLLYGVSPLVTHDIRMKEFKPVMNVESRVIAINTITKGDTVGYKAAWESSNDKKVAVVAFGYADGYPVTLSKEASVIINGYRCPVIARVSMDTMTVDVSHLPDVSVGVNVVLWGRELPVAEIAASSGLITYELLSRISKKRTCYIYKSRKCYA